jgi:predicted metalloprotease with PDZ domain
VKSGNGSGGTALTRSFMFGYGVNKTPTVDSLEGLIAHEMVHNWPTLSGDHVDTSWYAEGTAEYYSILLSYRAGLTTSKQFLDQINDRARGYYTNPLQSLSNHEAEQIYWKDSRAGHVPYGRGWVYLGIVDAEIRAKSHGKHSLDTIVLALLDRERHGQSITTDDWQNLVAAEIGPRARKEFAYMVAGKWLKPRGDEFAPCFHPVAIQVFPEELGFDAASLNGADRVIKGLVAGSAAEHAGLQNGDVVLDAPDIGDPSFKYSEPLALKIRRGDKEMSVQFIPHGKAVPAYKWVRNPRVSDAMCKV